MKCKSWFQLIRETISSKTSYYICLQKKLSKQALHNASKEKCEIQKIELQCTFGLVLRSLEILSCVIHSNPAPMPASNKRKITPKRITGPWLLNKVLDSFLVSYQCHRTQLLCMQQHQQLPEVLMNIVYWQFEVAQSLVGNWSRSIIYWKLG